MFVTGTTTSTKYPNTGYTNIPAQYLATTEVKSKAADFGEPHINKVIFNPPATIVFWDDDTKTVVKANKDDFDKEKGLAMAICKKMFGNKGNYYNEFKKWTSSDHKKLG